jgi:hypothetical protein
VNGSGSGLRSWRRTFAIRSRLSRAEALRRISDFSDHPAPLSGAASGVKECSVGADEFRIEYRGSRVLDLTIHGTIEEAPRHSMVAITIEAHSVWMWGATAVGLVSGARAWLGDLTFPRALVVTVACGALFATLDLWVAPMVLTRKISEWLTTELQGEPAPSTRRGG